MYCMTDCRSRIALGSLDGQVLRYTVARVATYFLNKPWVRTSDLLGLPVLLVTTRSINEAIDSLSEGVLDVKGRPKTRSKTAFAVGPRPCLRHVLRPSEICRLILLAVPGVRSSSLNIINSCRVATASSRSGMLGGRNPKTLLMTECRKWVTVSYICVTSLYAT